MTYDEFDKYIEHLINEAHSSGWYQGKMEAYAEIDRALDDDDGDAIDQFERLEEILSSEKRDDLMAWNGRAIESRRTWKRYLLEAYKEATSGSQDISSD
jgi:hypothetical protein